MHIVGWKWSTLRGPVTAVAETDPKDIKVETAVVLENQLEHFRMGKKLKYTSQDVILGFITMNVLQ